MCDQQSAPCLDWSQPAWIADWTLGDDIFQEEEVLPSAPILEEFDDWSLEEVDWWILANNKEICPMTVVQYPSLKEEEEKKKPQIEEEEKKKPGIKDKKWKIPKPLKRFIGNIKVPRKSYNIINPI